MPIISIITTTYKHKNFIAYTIESVLSQTFIDWELLIGDDSPDEETWNVIQSYVKRYPNKIRARHHDPNKGIVNNMNFLLKNISSETDYITFLEGDDMYTLNNLEEKMRIFTQHTDIGVVTTGSGFIDGNNNLKKISNLFTPEYYQTAGIKQYTVRDMLLAIQPPVRSFGNVIFRKELLQYMYSIDLGIYTDEKIFIPYDFISRLHIFPETRVYHIPDKIFIYRFHDNNNSDPKNFKRGLKQILFIFSLYEQLYKKEVLYVSNLVKSKIFALEGNSKMAIRYLFRAIVSRSWNKNIAYKISIILDILRVKRIIIKILFLCGCKQ